LLERYLEEEKFQGDRKQKSEEKEREPHISCKLSEPNHVEGSVPSKRLPARSLKRKKKSGEIAKKKTLRKSKYS